MQNDDFDDMMDVVKDEEEEEEELVKPFFTVYSKSECSFCDKAAKILDTHYRDSWKKVNCDSYLTNPADKADFLAVMEEKCGKAYKTFPMIFVKTEKDGKDVFLGGYTEMMAYIIRIEN